MFMRQEIRSSDHQHENWWPHFLDLVVHFVVVVVEKMIEKRRKSNIFVCAHPLCVSPAYLHLLSSRVNNVFPKGSMLLRSIATFLWEKVKWTKDEIIIKGNTFHFHQNMSKIFFLQSKNMNPNINTIISGFEIFCPNAMTWFWNNKFSTDIRIVEVHCCYCNRYSPQLIDVPEKINITKRK